MRAPLVFSLSLLAACGSGSGTVAFTDDKSSSFSETTADDGTTGTTGTTDDPVAEDWSGASLVVEAPAPGEVLPYGEDSTFTAYVLDADGGETDFADLVWTTSASSWTETGVEFESDGLDVGSQAITVEAALPDGTVLKNTIGGIKVQHPDAGTYVGNLTVDISGEYNDLPITASCVGAAIVGVDVYGETATGDSTCIVSLLGFSTEALHVFDFEVDDDAVVGMVSLDLSFFQIDFEVEGGIADSFISAEWATNYGGFIDVAGGMNLERVSTEVASGE